MSNVNPELRFRMLWLVLAYGLLATIVYLSVTGDPIQVNTGLPFQDKFFHALAYFSLMGWFVQIYHIPKQRVIYAALFIALGVFMEFVQSMSPARYYEFADMVANAMGVIVAMLLARFSTFRYLLWKFEKALP